MEYFVYRLTDDNKTYGDFVFHTDDLKKAVAEAKAHKLMTKAEYGVFERKERWMTKE